MKNLKVVHKKDRFFKDSVTAAGRRFQLKKAELRRFLREEDGAGVVEVILILVVIIGLVLVFKEQLSSLVDTIFNKINRNANSV